MRWSLALTLALTACRPQPDTSLAPTPGGLDEQSDPSVDVAAAPLNLGEATAQPLEGWSTHVEGFGAPGQPLPSVRAVALSQTVSWALVSDALLGRAGAETWSVRLGSIAPTDVAAGYDRSAFVLDGAAGAVHRADGEAFTMLASDDALVGARALVRIGGSLFVGGPRGVVSVSLSDGSVSSVRGGLDVLDLTVDDVGALLLLLHPGGVARIFPAGEDAPLSSVDPGLLEGAKRIAFDLTTSELIAVGGTGFERIAYASLVPEGPTSRPSTHGEMGPFLERDFILAGAEYWPHRGSTPAKYPEEILWGFYPVQGEVWEGSLAVATATPAAVGCAEQSFAALRAWIPTATAALAGATATGMAPRFYLWVNDYSEAVDPFPTPMRESKLWYWARDPGVPGRIPGYFKWETVLDQKGACHWPQPAQAMAFLKEAAAAK